jgi:TnpA family transposase
MSVLLFGTAEFGNAARELIEAGGYSETETAATLAAVSVANAEAHRLTYSWSTAEPVSADQIRAAMPARAHAGQARITAALLAYNTVSNGGTAFLTGAEEAALARFLLPLIRTAAIA